MLRWSRAAIIIRACTNTTEECAFYDIPEYDDNGGRFLSSMYPSLDVFDSDGKWASLTFSDMDSQIIGNLSELSFSTTLYVSVAYVLLGYFALRDVLSMGGKRSL